MLFTIWLDCLTVLLTGAESLNERMEHMMIMRFKLTATNHEDEGVDCGGLGTDLETCVSIGAVISSIRVQVSIRKRPDHISCQTN